MLSTDRLLYFVKVRIVKKEEAFLRLPPFFYAAVGSARHPAASGTILSTR